MQLLTKSLHCWVIGQSWAVIIDSTQDSWLFLEPPRRGYSAKVPDPKIKSSVWPTKLLTARLPRSKHETHLLLESLTGAAYPSLSLLLAVSSVDPLVTKAV